MLEQGDECVQHAGRQLDSITQLTVRRGGFDHPQRELQGLPIGLAHGHRQVWPMRPGDDLETAAMERVERIVDRHRGRHGIQRGCRSTSTCICSSSAGSTCSKRMRFRATFCSLPTIERSSPTSTSPRNAQTTLTIRAKLLDDTVTCPRSVIPAKAGIHEVWLRRRRFGREDRPEGGTSGLASGWTALGLKPTWPRTSSRSVSATRPGCACDCSPRTRSRCRSSPRGCRRGNAPPASRAPGSR